MSKDMIRTIDLKKKAQLHIFIPITLCFPDKQEITLHALLDSGAEASLLQEVFIPQKYWIPLDKKGILNDFMGRQVPITHKVQKLEVHIPNIHGNLKIYYFDFALLPKQLDTDCILGMDNLRYLSPFDKHYFELDGQMVPRIPLPAYLSQHYTPSAQRGEVTLIEQNILVQDKICTYNINISNEFEKVVHNMLEPLYSDNPLKWFDRSPRYCTIEFLEKFKDSKVRVNSIMVSPFDKEEFGKQINELLTLKLIQQSSSPHSSPAFIVRNHAEIKRGKARMVINYRKLNEYTKFDGYFIPTAEHLVKQIQGAKYYSKFDAKSGFFQIKLADKSSIEMTAFSCPQGHFEWLVMPFGLKNAPQIFQKWMNSIFGHIPYVVVYIDDILVFSHTQEEHKRHLLDVIQLLLKNGIILSPKKIELFKTEIDFLGKSIKNGSIQLQQHIYTKIKDFQKTFTTLKELQSFLGLLNYGRKFIPNLSEKISNLQKKLTDEQAKYKRDTGEQPRRWNTDKIPITLSHIEEQEIRDIKSMVVDQKILYFPKEEELLILQTDASDLFWAGVIISGHKEIVAYTSGKFDKTQIKYATYDKELLAIKLALKSLIIHLLHRNFLIETDNKSVAQFLKKKTINNPEENLRRIRIALYLEIFTYDVKYIPGYTNFVADLLTRP
jgi:hypothetical protein